MRTLSAIVVEVDDEEIAALKRFEQENFMLFTVVAYVPNLDTLVDLINETKPDVLIVSFDNLTVKNLNLNALKVSKPKLIYTSNKKASAYKAYKNNAIDFLLKPLKPNELIISIYKAIKFKEMEMAFQELSLDKIDKINKSEKHSKYVSIASVDKIELLKVSEIIFCKADGKYTEFITVDNGKVISSKNLGHFEDILKSGFFRVHHSYIININFLNKIKKENGTFCELTNGDLIPVSKRRQESFIKFINK